MSTRGAIARLTNVVPLCFAGRYHHWDSYPSGLGRTLWHLYHGPFKRDLKKMLNILIDEHPAGWSTINGADFTLTAGFDEWNPDVEQPDVEQMDRPQCYCHGDRNEEEWLVTEENAAGSGVEWVYVFTSVGANDPAKEVSIQRYDTMLVLSSYTQSGDKMIGMFGQGDSEAVWLLVAIIDLDDPEPDWEHLERTQPPELPVVCAASAVVSTDEEAGEEYLEEEPLQNGAYAVRRDPAQRGLYHVHPVGALEESPHVVTLLCHGEGGEEMFCTCLSEEAASAGCPHIQAVRQHRRRNRE